MNMRLMRALALLCLCSRACAEEGDYIVAVDAAGEVQSTHSTHGATGYGSSKAEPMSLNAILPHWPEAAVSQQSAQVARNPREVEAQADVDEGDEEGEEEEGDEEGDEEPDTSDKSSGEKDAYSFTYRQHVVGSTPTGELGIGTPSVNLNMILDTGSDKFVAKTWSTIKAELDKIDAGASEEVFPSTKLYNHNASKSYMQLFMSSHGKKIPRQGFIAYGSGMAITVEGRETIRIGAAEEYVSMQKFPISEISMDSLQILHSSKGISGILGLQHMMNRSLGQSFYSKLRDKRVLHSFGYCRGKKNDGTFIWGDRSSEGKAVNVEGQMHWAVKLSNMRVRHRRHKAASLLSDDADGDTVSSKPSSHAHHKFHLCRENAPCVAVIDTGSNILAMPSEAVRMLTKTLDVSSDCSNMDQLPNLHFALGEGIEISLPPAAYIMKVKLPWLPRKDKSSSEDSENSEESDSSSESSAASTEATRDQHPKNGKAKAKAKVKVHHVDADEDRGDVMPEASKAKSRHRQQRPPLELTEQEEGDTFQAEVESFVEETRRQQGLDLRAVLASSDLALLLKNTSTLCMPAIVPLDRETQKGTLLVVGGPLFERYYTRWAWPEGQKPQVFVQDLHKAEACAAKEETTTESEAGKTPKMTVWRSHENDGRMIRAEKGQRHLKSTVSADLSEMPSELRPREITLDDIRYPHWARYLDEL
ncbi:PGA [Symbiodinium natans]|uniref:PGA protein n=1 Tax=Symbiodinium natans TaxID=878477 RepID=A0A812QPR0_9DINO|nr:PGA [Symbiodinium natans]